MLRQERFTGSVTIGKSSNQVSIFGQSPLIMKYKRENQNTNIKEQMEKKLFLYIKKHNQSDKILHVLSKVLQQKNQQKIEECLIYLYTLQSFLYKHINKYLRQSQFIDSGNVQIVSNHYQTAHDLLPYCYLLNKCVKSKSRWQFKGTVYRGCNLGQDHVQEYKQNIGQIRQWNGFTSTTKNRKKAQNFGNVLFVIILGQQDYGYGGQFGLQIEKYSAFPTQQQVLLFAGQQIKTTKIEKVNNKTIITVYVCDFGP